MTTVLVGLLLSLIVVGLLVVLDGLIITGLLVAFGGLFGRRDPEPDPRVIEYACVAILDSIMEQKLGVKRRV